MTPAKALSRTLSQHSGRFLHVLDGYFDWMLLHCQFIPSERRIPEAAFPIVCSSTSSDASR